MVFQNYMLFPHMTALDNVAFGPRGLADITSDSAADLDLAPGTSLWAGLKATAIRNYPA